MKRIFFGIVSILFLYPVNAQDLNCQVQVDASTIQLTNKQIFVDLQQSIYQFLNNRKWVQEEVNINERINATFIIRITKYSIDNFSAEVQVQSSRPVYGSSYNSPLFSFLDRDWKFQYSQAQPMDFQDGSNIYGLTTLLAFYTYIIIGLDYNSFSKDGGIDYLNKALALRNAAINEAGWGPSSAKGSRNKYYLIDNLLDDRFKPIHTCFYTYHLKGMDRFTEDKEEAQMTIFKSLGEIKKVFDAKPNSVLLRVFFNAKKEELISIFSQSSPSIKNRVVELLKLLDPGNASDYDQITSS